MCGVPGCECSARPVVVCQTECQELSFPLLASVSGLARIRSAPYFIACARLLGCPSMRIWRGRGSRLGMDGIHLR